MSTDILAHILPLPGKLPEEYIHLLSLPKNTPAQRPNKAADKTSNGKTALSSEALQVDLPPEFRPPLLSTHFDGFDSDFEFADDQFEAEEAVTKESLAAELVKKNRRSARKTKDKKSKKTIVDPALKLNKMKKIKRIILQDKTIVYFKPFEDKVLRNAVERYGPTQWREILHDPIYGTCLHGKTAVDLKSRWRILNYSKSLMKKNEKTDTLGVCEDVQIDDDNNDESSRANKDQDENEDFCAACKYGGNLICCDTCVRSYHTECVNIDKAESLGDTWDCPYCAHYCLDFIDDSDVAEADAKFYVETLGSLNEANYAAESKQKIEDEEDDDMDDIIEIDPDNVQFQAEDLEYQQKAIESFKTGEIEGNITKAFRTFIQSPDPKFDEVTSILEKQHAFQSESIRQAESELLNKYVELAPTHKATKSSHKTSKSTKSNKKRKMLNGVSPPKKKFKSISLTNQTPSPFHYIISLTNDFETPILGCTLKQINNISIERFSEVGIRNQNMDAEDSLIEITAFIPYDTSFSSETVHGYIPIPYITHTQDLEKALG